MAQNNHDFFDFEDGHVLYLSDVALNNEVSLIWKKTAIRPPFQGCRERSGLLRYNHFLAVDLYTVN